MYVPCGDIVWFGNTVSVTPLDVTFILVTLIVWPKLFPNWSLSPPFAIQRACGLPNPEKPVIVAEADEEGLNMPREYRTPATMTMIKMAQP